MAARCAVCGKGPQTGFTAPVSRMAAGVLLYLTVHKPCCGEWRRHE